MSQDPTSKPIDEGQLSDEQLEDVAGGLSDRQRDEFVSGQGNKGLSDRQRDEFIGGQGNQLSEEQKDQFLGGQGNQ
jgi:hypothetical protein